jgi:sugar O-acyltransferase (sialic acid O-acetyltransferase NeuD family)
MAKLIIFGAGDIAKIAHFYFTRDSEHEVVAFTVDRDYREAERFLDLPLVDFEMVGNLYPPGDHRMFVAISYAKTNKLRAAKYAAAKAEGYQLMSYVSSRCTFLAEEPLGDNCFILEDNTVQPFVKIGSNVTLWSGNHIGHDAIIGDHCFISSHVVVSGRVRIGPYCFLGVNATIRNGITLAAETVVGAGAIIMKDTVEKGVYIPKRAELFSKTSDQVEI